MSLGSKTLVGLGLGLGTGAALASGVAPAVAEPLRQAADLVGVLFVNTIRMTVLPLVVSSLVAGVGAWRQPRAVGRLITHAVLVFALAAAAAAVFALVMAWPLLMRLAIDPRTSMALQAASAPVAAQPATGLFTWLSELVSPNPVKAAADGAVLPLVVFALLIGLALTRVHGEQRDVLIKAFEGLRDALLVLVGWVLMLAPVGVFGLAVGTASRLGIGGVAAVVSYVLIVVALTIAFVVAILYPTAVAVGFPLRVLVRGLTAAQSLAFSSRSTLASLPAMMAAASRALALAPEATACLIPLAASLSRVGGAVGQVVGTLFLARLYGIDIALIQLPAIILVTVLTTLTVPGIPGGSIIAMVPVLAVAGVPAEGIGILLGLDAVPDMFRTAANVTGGIVTAGIAARYDEWTTGDTVPSPHRSDDGTIQSRVIRHFARKP